MADATQREQEDTAQPDLSGRQLGDYRLLRRLGQGAMAEVYLAEQCSLRRQVAIKVLRSNLARDATYIERFQLEAQAAASLINAHIVQIHEVGCVDQIHYIAQEYVQGQNLRQWLARKGPATLEVALRVMRHVAIALAKAAQQQIVHRDIKPENIMLARNGEVKVADFGLARIVGEGGSVDLTQVGVTMGTPLYMSPEQVEGKPLDPRSDLYSFGVTCYHMLAGKPPFEGETALSVAVQHLQKQPERLEALRPDLPEGLCRIVHKMLAKEPAQRYQSAKQLWAELRRLQAAGPQELREAEAVVLHTEGDEDQLDTERSRATARLDQLMKTSALESIPRKRRWGGLVATFLVAFAIGTLLATATGHQSLLADAQPESVNIPRRKSVQEQWIFALQDNREPAWRSVVEYFPDELFYIRHARQQLARIYLSSDRYAEAMTEFDYLANLPETEPRLRAFGLAGKCVVLSLRQRYAESAELAGQLSGQVEEIDDAMRRYLLTAMATNRKALDRRMADDLERTLEEAFQSDDP